ncbi:hypothetical protein K469DRAFT_576726, partial [Zopfia rhizophila CBS 207.26]
LVNFACSVIITALLGHFFYFPSLGNEHADGCIVYARVIAYLGVVFSIALFPSLEYTFYAFPIGAIIFICSIVEFGLLADLTGTDSCSAHSYWHYWGYRCSEIWHVGPRVTITFGDVGSAGCWSWKCILAFTYIGAMAWLLSAFLVSI